MSCRHVHTYMPNSCVSAGLMRVFFLIKKSGPRFGEVNRSTTFAAVIIQLDGVILDSVAQLVEQMTLNHWVESSSLSGVTVGF